MVLNPEDKEFLDGLIIEAAGLDSPVLHILHRIQKKFGMISQIHGNYIADRLGITRNRLFSVATFYEEFSLRPRGRFVIRVCRGISCHSRGSKDIFDTVSEHLGIKDGETTDDGLFTLIGASCIGQCDGGPALMINEDVFRALDKYKVLDLIEGYRKGGA